MTLIRGQAGSDLPDLRGVPDGHHDAFTAATDHARAGISHGPSVGNARRRRIWLDAHSLRDGFAGQDAPIEDESFRPTQAEICRYDVTDAQEDHVAGHQVGSGQINDSSAAPHLGTRSGCRAQCLERLFPSVLGGNIGGDQREESCEDQQPVADFADEGSSDACNQEQQHKRLRCGLHHEAPDLWRVRRGERVGPDLHGPAQGVDTREADPWIDTHDHGDRVRGERVGVVHVGPHTAGADLRDQRRRDLGGFPGDPCIHVGCGRLGLTRGRGDRRCRSEHATERSTGSRRQRGVSPAPWPMRERLPSARTTVPRNGAPPSRPAAR